jgi:hypothetical protein
MLRLFYSHEDVLQSKELHSEARRLAASRSAHVGMAGFVTCTNPDRLIALGTSGVMGCAIMLMHTKQYTGSLGHYAGTADPAKITEGLDTMFPTLGVSASEIDCVVVMSMVASQFALAVEGSMLKRYPAAKVYVIEQVYDSCYYFPGDGKAAFFDQNPGDIRRFGTTPVDGLCAYGFGAGGKAVKLASL